MPDVEAIYAEYTLLSLILLVVLSDGPLLQGLTRQEPIQEIFLLSMVPTIALAFFECKRFARDRLKAISNATTAIDSERLRCASYLLLLG